MPNRPGFYFFPADWRSDAGLRVCSEGARYLWFEMLGCMCESTKYGHMLVGGRKPTPAEIALATNTDPEAVEARLAELERNRVFSRTRKGVIFSRRMVRDDRRQQTARKNGKLGGNPTLRNSKGNGKSDNPPDNPITLPSQANPSQESESLAGKPESQDPRAAQPEPASQLDPALVDRLEELVEARRQTVVDLRGSVAGWHQALGHDGWLAAKIIELLHRDDVPKPFNWLASAVDGELRRRAGLARTVDPPPPRPPDGFLARAARLGFDAARLAGIGLQRWQEIAAESEAGRLDDEAVRAALAWCERNGGRPWRPGAPGQGSEAA